MLKSFGRLFFVNLFIVGLWGIAFLLSHIAPNNVILRLFESSMVLSIIFPLTGLNLTLILERLAKQHFDLFERLAVTALLSLTLPPLLLLGEFSLFHTLFPALPFLNAVIIFFIAITYCPFGLEKTTAQITHPSLKDYGFTVMCAALVFLLVIMATVGAYYHLPESDPYYWLTKIQQEITTGIFPTGEAYRPLLSYLVYLFTVTAQVDLYAFFKYILPGFLQLTLFPVSLIARRLPRAFDQFVFLLLPLSSASIVMYFLLPIPQALINTIFIFFIFLVLHALFTKNNFFFFLAGATLFMGYFYHDLALLFLAPWLLVTLLFWRKALWIKVMAHKVTTLVLIALIVPFYSTLLPLVNFFKNWLVRIIPTLEQLETNFAFPLAYVNIDGRAVGWGNYVGGAKYYLFYGGPILCITVALFFFILLSSKRRQYFLQTYQTYKEIIVLLIIFLLFFALAEIFPRFFSIALLPERALGFAGLVSISLLPLVYFLLSPKGRNYLVWLVFLAIIINTSAALHINSLKKDLISPARIASMQWIKNNLPPNRAIVVQRDLTVMKTFSQTESLLEIPNPALYTDSSVFDRALELPLTPSNLPIGPVYTEYVRQSEERFGYLKTIDPFIPQNIPPLRQELKRFRDTTNHLLSLLPSDTLEKAHPFTKQPLYIYYAQQEVNSLYASRPYYHGEPPITSFVFDTDKRFRKIYNDQANNIYIWKFNPALP